MVGRGTQNHIRLLDLVKVWLELLDLVNVLQVDIHD